MMKQIKLFAVLLMATFSFTLQAETEMSVEGLDGDLEENVEAYLSAIPEDEYSVSLRFQSRVETSIKEALKALGFYDPVITFNVSGEQGSRLLVVNVIPGEPVSIYDSDIIIDGEAKFDPEFIAAVANSGLNLGAVLNHGNYDALKTRLRNLALRKGYFDGDFSVTRLEVSPERKQAFVHLHYDSGDRYFFGKTFIDGSQIEDYRVQSIIPYQSGDPYLASKVGEFNQSLSNTEWFSSVLVEPDINNVSQSGELPMQVHLSPQTKNLLETGIGYSTDVGIRGKINWKKPWLNSYGHSLKTSLSISNPEQTVTAAYKIPLENVLRDYYIVQYGMKNIDDRDTDSLESNLAFERHWVLDSGWHRTLFTRLLYEEFTQGKQDGSSWLVLPGITLSKTRSRGGMMPMWGDRKSITFEGTDPALSSDARLVRVQAHTTWIRSLGQNHRGLFGADVGAIYTDEFDSLPPSIRFFAGGDNSLRGYGYEEISPKDSDGFLTGGQYMATSSLEYQYRVVGNWWLATFVDYGDAWASVPQWKTGVGAGIRWGSPVGPVSLDFAWGLEQPQGEEFHIHFSLGPEI
ncbi:autotransporter assembly complex protein TamA [Aliivibrio kagoshimensis]|uniref:autotransporter assembly complex protein TamA n=1 Tax=Aliivibrio kagoshimensis TaxID=2910230 RepID=UPI003D115DD3